MFSLTWIYMLSLDTCQHSYKQSLNQVIHSLMTKVYLEGLDFICFNKLKTILHILTKNAYCFFFLNKKKTHKQKLTSLIYRHWYRHTPRYNPKVQCAFKISMTHWILQFALRIAVRSVLHRCASLDIHCWKLLSSL